MSRSRKPLICLCVMLAAWMLHAGCNLFAPPAADPIGDKGYVGKLSERDALISLIIEGDEVLGYVCDAVEGNTSISSWFEGSLEGDQFELTPIMGTTYETTSLGAAITGTLSGDFAEGVLTLEDGTQLNWMAETARDDRAAGLYLHGDGEELSTVIVDNDEEHRGLSKSRITGWTTRVVATSIPRQATRELPVQIGPVSRIIPIVTKLPIIKPIIQPPVDPLPTEGGTLMIHVVADKQRATGFRYVVKRPDNLGVPTIRLTQQLRDLKGPKTALQRFMRVRVLDTTGKIISGHFIDDPFWPFVEAPADAKAGIDPFWTRVERNVTSFLLAVPDVKGARKVAFTRFKSNGFPVYSGLIDLEGKPVPKGRKDDRRAAVATGYPAEAAEHSTIIDNGSPETRMDLLILAEGFENTNTDRELFDQKVNDLLTFLWTIPIYEEVRQSINVHIAYVPANSNNAGFVGNGPDSLKDTPFQSFFNCADIDRLLCLSQDGQDYAYEVAEDAPGNYGAGSVDTIAVLCNDSRYGGGGGAILTCSINAQSPEIFSHEFGHTVVDLADEYEDEYNDTMISAAQVKPNVSKPVVNRNELKWIDLVDPATAIPTQTRANCDRQTGCTASALPAGTVGMFEGAGYSGCGSFRPTTECQMRCYVGFFCEVCKNAYRDTFGPYQPPTTDVYMRDNSLDRGDVPSPTNVTDANTGQYVRPWQSVDIRVDAPPFGDPATNAHENAIAGVLNRVYVTLHNRGTLALSVFTNVQLFYARATNGAPPFPGLNWTFISETGGNVAGQNGMTTLTFEWSTQADLPPHTCLLALADAVGDPLPELTGALSAKVRNNNNVTWKNLHVVRNPSFQTELSNFERSVAPTVVRFTTFGFPLDTKFRLTHDPALGMSEFEPADPRQMEITFLGGGIVDFVYTAPPQDRLLLRTDLPPGAENSPFATPITLEIQLPGGTPTGVTYYVTFEQLALDPESGALTALAGGNTYEITLD